MLTKVGEPGSPFCLCICEVQQQDRHDAVQFQQRGREGEGEKRTKRGYKTRSGNSRPHVSQNERGDVTLVQKKGKKKGKKKKRENGVAEGGDSHFLRAPFSHRKGYKMTPSLSCLVT